MKYLKEKEKRRSPVGKILLAIVLILVVFAGGFWTGSVLAPEDETEHIQPEQESQHQETTGDSQTVPEETSPSEQPVAEGTGYVVSRLTDTDVVVPTPYGEIYYPVQFEEFLRITHEFSDGQYAVHFNVDIGVGEIVNMFSVYFAKDNGKQLDGNVIGGFRDEDGKLRLVIVTVNEELPYADWDDDTANLIYAMQENITYCMEKLERLEGLTLAE